MQKKKKLKVEKFTIKKIEHYWKIIISSLRIVIKLILVCSVYYIYIYNLLFTIVFILFSNIVLYIKFVIYTL